MVTPYKNARAGPKDNFNYYHSQIRISIECAFGKLVRRWGILRAPMSSVMGVTKQLVLTLALCMLHNFCIGDRETVIPETNESDAIRIVNAGGISLDNDNKNYTPDELLDCGNHFDEFDPEDLRDYEKCKTRYSMRKQVEQLGLHCYVNRRNS